MTSNALLRLLPAPFIRMAGRLWRNVPMLRGSIGLLGRTMAQEGRIAHGAGRGLWFNARGANPGYVAGTSEPLEQELVMKYLRPGAVVYNLGAKIGLRYQPLPRSTGSSPGPSDLVSEASAPPKDFRSAVLMPEERSLEQEEVLRLLNPNCKPKTWSR
jgi:hypothetical protein